MEYSNENQFWIVILDAIMSQYGNSGTFTQPLLGGTDVLGYSDKKYRKNKRKVYLSCSSMALVVILVVNTGPFHQLRGCSFNAPMVQNPGLLST